MGGNRNNGYQIQLKILGRVHTEDMVIVSNQYIYGAQERIGTFLF